MTNIKDYWEERARSGGFRQATTDDVYLRELEITTLTAEIRAKSPAASAWLDLGCGDGYSTLTIARSFPELMVTGVDYTENMVGLAREALAGLPDLRERVRFDVGDALTIGEVLPPRSFSTITTMRCLINLEDRDRQAQAIGQIAQLLRPGGWYLGIENFTGGQKAMNDARRAVGLEEIPVRWHNFFFDEADVPLLFDRDFDTVESVNFSSAYYYATRVVYSAMCKMIGEKPDYEHPIHRLAVNLPPIGDYSPIKLIRARRRVE